MRMTTLKKRFEMMRPLVAINSWFFGPILVTILCIPHSIAQDADKPPELIGTRTEKRWVIPVATSGTTKIPRVCASLRAAYFEGFPDKSVVVHPEIAYWEIRFPGAPVSPNVVLEFDSYPSTIEEATPTKQAGDGTLTLWCSQGRTVGEKLRFEPQPHKNTIGYWAVATDSVSWPVQISRPGRLNVGLLQGAGDNCGGIARISILSNGEVVDSLEYQVEVTGHFQNFIWKHAGTLTVAEPGDYSIRIEGVKINTAALMDVRQVHLSPNPLDQK